MCLNPLHIKNPKKDFNTHSDRVYIDVPCGKCEECVKNKIMSFQIRSYYEFKHCVEHCGGKVFYYTLTFNNKHIPKVTFSNRLNCVSYSFPVFDKKFTDNFKRNFKNCMKRRNLDYDVKFFIVSEYGGNTRRPHHHVLIFIYGSISPYTVLDIVTHSWIKEDGKFNSVPLGNVMPGDNLGVVNSSSAILYVSKYVAKSESYDDVLKKVRKAYMTSQDYYNYCSTSFKGYQPVDLVWLEIEKKLTPYVSKSIEFGTAVKYYMSDIQKKYGTCKFENKKNAFISVPLPLYLLRKFYYDTVTDVNGNVLYVLNEKGIERKIALCDRIIQKRVSFIQSLETAGYLPDDLLNAFSHYTGFSFSTYLEVCHYLSNLLDGRSIKDLVIYDLIYKGRPFLKYTLNSYTSDYDLFLSRDLFALPSSPDGCLLYDGLSCFENFDHCLFIIKLIKVYFSYVNYLERYRRKMEKSRVLQSIAHDNDNIKSNFHPPKTISQFSNYFCYATNEQTSSSTDLF